jgi:hypothetical protein
MNPVITTQAEVSLHPQRMLLAEKQRWDLDLVRERRLRGFSMVR